MEACIAFAPEVGIGADEFVFAWDESPSCREIARAEKRGPTPAGYGIHATAAVVFLAGFVGKIAADVVTALIKEQAVRIIKETFVEKRESDPEFEVFPVKRPDGRRIFVVKEKS